MTDLTLDANRATCSGSVAVAGWYTVHHPEARLLMSAMIESEDSPAGRTGYVTVAIPGPGRPGEVRISIRGGTEAFLAYAEEAIARGTQVLIVGDRGGRAVDVIGA
jgi:hypothetical protein